MTLLLPSMGSSPSHAGLRGAHKESVASKQPVSMMPNEKKLRQKFIKIFPCQHHSHWGRCFWRPALSAMAEAVEQWLADVALRADGTRPRHPHTPRYTQSVAGFSLPTIFSSGPTGICSPDWRKKFFHRKKLSLHTVVFLQVIHWCVTVRWGGTRGGITMDGRSVVDAWYAT